MEDTKGYRKIVRKFKIGKAEDFRYIILHRNPKQASRGRIVSATRALPSEKDILELAQKRGMGIYSVVDDHEEIFPYAEHNQIVAKYYVIEDTTETHNKNQLEKDSMR